MQFIKAVIFRPRMIRLVINKIGQNIGQKLVSAVLLATSKYLVGLE